ncbi:MAG: glycosyltransferase [Chloroflexota bacterium]
MPPTVDLVIPVYNESGVVEQFHAQLRQVIDALPDEFGILYVNDGSSDGTADDLARIAASDQRVTVLELSRNFGHQAALSAGLARAEGDVVISLDGDGQHPPALIPEMLKLVEQGYDIVQTQRLDDAQGASFKHVTSRGFYWLINRMSGTPIQPGAADFRAMSRRAVDALVSMPEYHRFLRGMVSWIGFPTVILPYQPPKRLGGSSKYSLKKMLRLASDAVFSFSLMPLYLGISLGGLFLFLAVLEVIYVLSFWVTGRQSTLEPGWSSLMFVLLIVGGVIMILLGFIGMYIGYIFQEVKRRPVFIVRREYGGKNNESASQRVGDSASQRVDETLG